MMDEMHADDGGQLWEPEARIVHRHSWQWAKEGRGECSVVETVRRGLCLFQASWRHESERTVAGEFLFGLVEYRLRTTGSHTWRLVSMDGTSAVLERVHLGPVGG